MRKGLSGMAMWILHGVWLMQPLILGVVYLQVRPHTAEASGPLLAPFQENPLVPILLMVSLASILGGLLAPVIMTRWPALVRINGKPAKPEHIPLICILVSDSFFESVAIMGLLGGFNGMHRWVVMALLGTALVLLAGNTFNVVRHTQNIPPHSGPRG